MKRSKKLKRRKEWRRRRPLGAKQGVIIWVVEMLKPVAIGGIFQAALSQPIVDHFSYPIVVKI